MRPVAPSDEFRAIVGEVISKYVSAFKETVAAAQRPSGICFDVWGVELVKMYLANAANLRRVAAELREAAAAPNASSRAEGEFPELADLAERTAENFEWGAAHLDEKRIYFVPEADANRLRRVVTMRDLTGNISLHAPGTTGAIAN